MNMMQIAVQAVDALPAASNPFAAAAAPEQGQGFEKLLHERSKAVAGAGGNMPETLLDAVFQGAPQISEPVLPALQEPMPQLAPIPAEENAGGDAIDQDTDLTQVADPTNAAMQVVAAVTSVTVNAGAPVAEQQGQPGTTPVAEPQGSSAKPAELPEAPARSEADGERVAVAETAVHQGKPAWGEAAPEGRGNEVQRPHPMAGDKEPRMAGAQKEGGLSAEKAQSFPDVAKASGPSPAQPGNTAAAEPVGRTAAGLSLQQEIADRLAVSKAQTPNRQPLEVAAQQAPQGEDAQGAEQEVAGEALRQGGAARGEVAPQETSKVAQPATSGTAQLGTTGTAQQATSTVQQETNSTTQQAATDTAQQTITGTAQQAASNSSQTATGNMAQPADSAPQAAAAAIGGQERKTEARTGQAKGEGQRQELREAAEEPLEAVNGDTVTQGRPAVKPQGGFSVAGDADHADGHAGGAKDAPRKVAGIEGAGEAAVSKAQQVEQPAQPQAAAKATREEGALHRDVLAQVKQGTMVHDGKGNGTMSIRLNPGELGELKIQVHMEDNRFKVEVHAENRTVRDLLMNNLDSLKEALSGKDLAMEGFDVSTGGGDFFGRQAEQRESLRQQAMPKPVRLAGYEALEERRFTYATPAGGGLLDLRL
ncbi:hypothetical protein GEOBRER4_n3869 [Citrifermentans bremense]|uniref:Flagellar hook-length control protein-like C-terminal domain-containing protein n=1 Tax=Citrifermentans bremense TaxID=60035 RepID=A0A6S6MB92_9BACT|nr:flagellar hook-length control protein FliK [Citrifermentans bremense]BCG48974.1 hypothetical protein GEOBRER4_n3869 [Citrifermentans bremense]